MTTFVQVDIDVVRKIAAEVLEEYPEGNEDATEKYISFLLAKAMGDEILANQDALKYFEKICDLPPNISAFCESLVQSEINDGRVN